MFLGERMSLCWLSFSQQKGSKIKMFKSMHKRNPHWRRCAITLFHTVLGSGDKARKAIDSPINWIMIYFSQRAQSWKRTSLLSNKQDSSLDESVPNYYTARRPWFPPSSQWHYWKLVLKITLLCFILWDMKLLNEGKKPPEQENKTLWQSLWVVADGLSIHISSETYWLFLIYPTVLWKTMKETVRQWHF